MFDTASIEIPCPHCSHKISKTIGWLKTHDHVRCVSCGEGFTVDSKEFFRGIASVQKGFDDIKRTLGKLGK